MKSFIKHTLVVAFLSLGVIGLVPRLASALGTLPTAFVASADRSVCPAGTTGDPTKVCCPPGQVILDERSCCPSSINKVSDVDKPKACLYGKYLNPVINFLSALVGIVVTVGIILGAVQFSSSAGDPQKAASGKAHIRNALLGLLAYLLMYAFLQFIVPGGKLNG